MGEASFFIPKQINVGFQERSGTYTGKLAYIIYFDEKGKLRKETSWNSWRDDKINNQIFENEPTSGFVLNKKVGDYVSDWNHRQAYVRVYDPRDFEFEITIQNLLYILENATSTKGKGLEGDFVYGWDGKDLVLIPCEAPDYQELVKINALRHSDNKVTAKQLIVGATYRTRENKEYVYMGKFYEYSWNGVKSKKPKFWFYYRSENGGYFTTMGSVSQKLVEVISEESTPDYADLFEKMEYSKDYSPIDDSKDEFVPYEADELLSKFSDRWKHWGVTVYVHTGNRVDLRRGNEEDDFYCEYKNPNYNPRGYRNRYKLNDNDIDERYSLRETFKDIDDVIARLKPLRLRKYLLNGKVYSENTHN